jgi:Carboxypeptidase regulatory-like domain
MAIDSGAFYTPMPGPLMRSRTLTVAVFLALVGSAALGDPPSPPVPLASTMAPPISGVVRSVEAPVAGALVVLYNVAETSLARLRTAADGTFVLASAPVGVYDLIAYKKGFQPALVRILHQAAPQRVSSVEIQLAAASGKSPASSVGARPSTLWDLADRLPADVLRELDLDSGEQAARGDGRVRVDRLVGGEIATVAGASSSSLVQTTAALRGGLPNGWQYRLSGDYNSVSGDSDPAVTTGSSAGLALDVAPSEAERVQLSTRRNSISFGDDRPASFQAEAVRWSSGDGAGSGQSVSARYIEESNLYRASAPGTTFFPLASRTWEVQANYSRPAADAPGVNVSMAYRQREAMVGPSGVGSHGAYVASSPDADLSASGLLRVASRAEVEGGVVARYVAGGYGIAPRVIARYDIGDGTYLFVSGLYRLAESGIGSGLYLPRVTSIEDDISAASREGYSIGLERTVGENGNLRLEASQQRIDEVVRAFFEGDFLTSLDSVYLLDGNVVRQVKASGKRRLSHSLAASVSARYGRIDGGVAPGTAATYGVTDSTGHFWTARASLEVLPTRTGIAVTLHGVRQNLATPSSVVVNQSDRIALSLAQDLSVLGVTPFGSVCKLLVGIESNRPAGDNDEAPKNNRLLGGVALSF